MLKKYDFVKVKESYFGNYYCFQNFKKSKILKKRDLIYYYTTDFMITNVEGDIIELEGKIKIDSKWLNFVR